MKLYKFKDKNADYLEAVEVVVLAKNQMDALKIAIEFMEEQRLSGHKGVSLQDVTLIKEFDMTQPQAIEYVMYE